MLLVLWCWFVVSMAYIYGCGLACGSMNCGEEKEGTEGG